MGNFILSIMLALNIGAAGNLEQTFKKEDIKYLKRFVEGPVIVHSFGKSTLMDRDDLCDYFGLVFRDMDVNDVKISKPFKNKKVYLITLYTNNNGYMVTNKIVFDIYKKKIVQVVI